MLAAGLHGIESKMTPLSPVEENIFEFTLEEATEREIDVLPRNLLEALENLEKDRIIREALGSFIFEKFKVLKMREWDDYCYMFLPGKLNNIWKNINSSST